MDTLLQDLRATLGECTLPAFRAARTEPAIALRTE